jgi:integrase
MELLPQPENVWSVTAPIRLIPSVLTLWLRKQQGKETYYCRITIPKKYRLLNSERRYLFASCGTADVNEAKEAAFAKYYETKGKLDAGIPVSDMTIRSFIKMFLDDYLEKNPQNTHRDGTYRSKSKALAPIADVLGNKVLASISDADIEFYKAARMRQRKKKVIKSRVLANASGKEPPKTISVRTAEMEISVFKSILRWAKSKHLWNGELTYKIKKSHFRTRQSFTEAQWDKLTRHLRKNVWLKTAGKHGNDSRIIRHRHLIRAYILFMGNSGLRVGEARYLRFSDVVEKISDDGKPYLQIHIAASTSKVRKERWAIGRETALEAIARWKKWRQEHQNHCGEDDFIFANDEGKPIGDLREGFNAATKGAGVEYDNEGNAHTPYSLRHTYITFRLKNAKSLDKFELAQACGTSVQLIEKVYGHTDGRDFVRGLIS